MSHTQADRPTFSWPQVWGWRLHRHGLTAGQLATTPVDAVARMSGAHAQVMAAAELSIGIRMATGTRADVRHALWTERSLVKTFGPRGTVHLLPTQDLPMWTGALSAVPDGPDGLPMELRLTAAETDAIVEAMSDALTDAELTLDELGERVVAATGPWAGTLVIPAFNGLWPRWRRALIPAARRGVLCFGPDRGRNVTYTHPRRWLPGFAAMPPEQAIGQLVRRYLDGYGPATPAQLAQWLSAPRRWATDLFASMRDDLVEVDIEGTPGWLNATDLGLAGAMGEGPRDEIQLLPYFDAFTVGCHPRDQLFPGDAATRALSRGQAGNVPVLLVDGMVRGIWHQQRVRSALHITVEPFEPLRPDQLRQLEARVERIGAIAEAEPVLVLGVVQAGKHL